MPFDFSAAQRFDENLGRSPFEVRRIAENVRQTVADSTLVRDVQLDWGEQVRVQRVQLDQQKIAQLGLSSSDVSQPESIQRLE